MKAELVDELEQYGNTRNEQLETVLERAAESETSTDNGPNITKTLDRVDRRVAELQQQLDRLPDSIASELR